MYSNTFFAYTLLSFASFLKTHFAGFFMLILLVSSSSTTAQIGVNKSYDLNYAATYFGSIEASNDTIFTYGPLLKPGGPNGFAITLLDTFGQVRAIKEYFHPNGFNFTQVFSSSLIKLKHQPGFAVVGQVLDNGNGFMAITDAKGQVVKYKEYPDDSSRVDYYHQVIELNDGLLIFGRKQALNYLGNVFVKKTDFEGNQIWEKSFSKPNLFGFFGNAILVHANEYVIGMGFSTDPNVPIPQTKFKTNIISLDSLGNIKWQWETPLGLDEIGADNLFKTNDGNWAYKTSRAWYDPMYNEIIYQPKFVIRDTQFNLIRSDTFGEEEAHHGKYLWNAIQLRDSGFLAMGIKSGIGFSSNGPPGWLVRLDKASNQVWSRADTTALSFPTFYRCEYRDAIELSSGSIVACGSIRTDNPTLKDWAWLVKVSADGCVETLNCFTSGTEEPEIDQIPLVKITPNPTSGIIKLEYKLQDGSAPAIFQIYNLTGQIVLNRQLNPNDQHEVVSVENLPVGVYFWSMADEEGYLGSGKLIKVD
jgi:Secretion system C-terminal sorting domain